MSSWPNVALGDLLRRSDEPAVLDLDAEYHEVTIRLWGKGVISRRKVRGSAVGTVRHVVRANQLILSKIDARNGAIGLVPPELDGAIVSNDFPSFEFHDSSQCDPAFMGWLVRSAPFVELCKAASEGTTNRVRIKEDRFLDQQIALPKHAEQRTIVGRLNTLAEKTRHVSEHLDAVEAAAAALFLSMHHRLAGDRVVRLGDLIELFEDPVPVMPESQYPQVGVRGFGGGLFAKSALAGTETSYRAFNRLYVDAYRRSQVRLISHTSSGRRGSGLCFRRPRAALAFGASAHVPNNFSISNCQCPICDISSNWWKCCRAKSSFRNETPPFMKPIKHFCPQPLNAFSPAQAEPA